MALRTSIVTRAALVRVGGAAALAGLLVVAPSAQVSQDAQAQKSVPVVAAAALETMLPDAAGWTKGAVRSSHVEAGAECTYAFADSVYTQGAMRVRVTVADSGFNAESLLALAGMVATLPPDYSEKVPPATTVTRLLFGTSPAAARWDGEKREGEFEVLVGGRFVAKAEGTHVTNLDVVRGFVEQIDLKKFEQLK